MSVLTRRRTAASGTVTMTTTTVNAKTGKRTETTVTEPILTPAHRAATRRR